MGKQRDNIKEIERKYSSPGNNEIKLENERTHILH